MAANRDTPKVYIPAPPMLLLCLVLTQSHGSLESRQCNSMRRKEEVVSSEKIAA